MNRKLIFSLAFLVLCFPISLGAEIQITEIMYNPSGTDSDREWVEIYNAGNTDVTVVQGGTNAAWRLSDGTQHSLTLKSGTLTLAPGAYAVIVENDAQFKVDFPNFSGNLFDSSFSLSNTGGTVSVLSSKDGVTLNLVSYTSGQGANGNGNSLQLHNGAWIEALPTPGMQKASAPAEEEEEGTEDTEESENTGVSSHSSTVPLSTTAVKVVFEVSGGRDRLVAAGTPVYFEGIPTKLSGVQQEGIGYVWSFGDGTSMTGKDVTHAYRFPGEYVVVLNAHFSDQEAVHRLVIEVLEPEFEVGILSGGISVSNNASDEMNIQGWSLVSENKSFVFPKDTILLGGTTVVFSRETTGISEGKSVRLVNPLGVEVVRFEEKEKEDAVDEIAEIRIRIEEIQKEIAKLSIPMPKEVAVPVVVPEPQETQEVTQEVSPETQTAQVLTVFEGEKKQSGLTKIFRGLDFIKKIFVGE